MITDTQIRALRTEASTYGDTEMVILCTVALESEDDDVQLAAREQCALAVLEAQAQQAE